MLLTFCLSIHRQLTQQFGFSESKSDTLVITAQQPRVPHILKPHHITNLLLCCCAAGIKVFATSKAGKGADPRKDTICWFIASELTMYNSSQLRLLPMFASRAGYNAPGHCACVYRYTHLWL